MELIIESIIILILVIFQSIFGVGLLLFGTPIFLIIGYNFISTLTLLLPISIIISFLQIINQKKSFKPLINEFNFFCLPFLILFLMITLNTGDIVEIKRYVSIFLIISSIIILYKDKIIRKDKFFLKYRKFFLIFIGSVHGCTNMGGGFLSLFSMMINGNNNLLTRSYIAYGYLIMGILQYFIITITNFNNVDYSKLYYIFFPLLFYFPVQKFFSRLGNQLFMRIINFVALSFGIISLIISLR